MRRAGIVDIEVGSVEPAIRMRRIRHPLRVVLFFIVIASLLIGAFVAGRYVMSPTEQALRGAKASVDVTASVEQRVVSPGYALPATLNQGSAFDVVVTEASVQSPATAAPVSSDGTAATSAKAQSTSADSGTQRVVVTAGFLGAGDVVSPGRLVAEVSGRPIFAISTSVPLYRDLLPGMAGNDVRAVQQTLIDLDYYGVTTSGLFDTGTSEALGRLYANADYELPYVAPGVRGLAVHEFTGIPTNDATVLGVAGVGTVLSGDVPLVRLQTSAPVLTAQITTIERGAVEVGTTVLVASPTSGAIPTTVLTVGPFTTGEGSSSSGYPITLAVPDGLGADAGSVIQVTPSTQSAAGPAVPLIAVHQDGTRTFVVLAPAEKGKGADASAPPPVEVDVSVLAQADGWAAIEETAQLPIGQRVVVEP